MAPGSSSITRAESASSSSSQEAILGEIVDEPFELVEAELPADDRGDGERLVAAIGETVEAPPDHLAHTLGDANAPALASGEPFRGQLTLLQ